MFGARAGEAAAGDSGQWSVVSGQPEVGKQTAESDRPSALSTAVRKRVKRVMWERVGILRDERSLKRAIAEFEQIERSNLST